MAKFYELLSVESSISAQLNEISQETLKSFDRGDLFQRNITTKNFFSEDDKKLNTTEIKEITTTVADKLKYAAGPFIRFFDFAIQRDSTNQVSNADLVVEYEGSEHVIAKEVPGLTLLTLEQKLAEVRKVIAAAPTLPSGVPVKLDENENLWITTNPIVTFQTKKTTKPVVLYEATQHHPAQIEKVAEDINVAKIEKSTAYGMLTSAQKHELLKRVDALLQAAKKARQRANATEVKKAKIGEQIFKFVFDGIIK